MDLSFDVKTLYPTFSDLVPHDTFMTPDDPDDVYMKIELIFEDGWDEECGLHNAVSLRDGTTAYFRKNDSITPVNCSVTVRNL